eukprot:TRINITY_DN13146_c0_g1_i1.p1 TRINITY_DN13146_c0_g1~~TRINITY_DN13146_c0_g1_i1.p1  ORF type:complete len:276 (-),score=70.84 TRINITY_DN13146_c0_g1_i1:929-1756(-)
MKRRTRPRTKKPEKKPEDVINYKAETLSDIYFPSISFTPQKPQEFLREDCMTHLAQFFDINSFLNFSATSLSNRQLLKRETFWKQKLHSLFKTGFDDNLIKNSSSSYFDCYHYLLSQIARSYKWDECLGEQNGDCTLEIDKWGKALWEGFGEGNGRAGEDYAKNTIGGSGTIEIVLCTPNSKSFSKNLFFGSHFQVLVSGKETVKWGSCEKIYHKEEEEEEEDEDEDEEEAEEEPEIGEVHYYDIKTGEVTYYCRSTGIFEGGDLINDMTINMEW